MVFQSFKNALNPRLTAGQIIAEPLRIFDRPRKLLAMVGFLPDDESKLPQQFSGGKLQRVCIAWSLAPQPRWSCWTRLCAAWTCLCRRAS
ncbi:MAG: hypothetical protein R6W92_12095 [Desulfocurvibacter africanus]